MENLSEIIESKKSDLTSTEKENKCDFCNKIIEKEKEIKCPTENCDNKYCSLDCQQSHNHIHDNIEPNTHTNINRISVEKLFETKITLPEDSNKGITGLVNIGNTCFMNSALQCLSNCCELTKYFLSDLYKNEINFNNRLGTKGEIVNIYRQLLKDLWEGKEESINPTYFKNIFSQFVEQFSGYNQQDSNEFLMFLLDKLHEDINSVSKKEYLEDEKSGNFQTDNEVAEKSWKRYLKRENSIIVDLFHGQFKSTINCKYCNRISKSFDSFNNISVPIPSKRYEINIKYFGYNFNNFFEVSVPINEDTVASNVIDIIKLKIYTKKEKISNKNKEKTKNRNKKKRGNDLSKNEELKELTGDYVEILLLDSNKKIYKVFDPRDYIYLYITQGYELVAYEKNIKNENIYFYLTKYSENSSYFNFFGSSKQYLFDYPFAINSAYEDKIYFIYINIIIFLKEFFKTTKKDINKIDFKQIKIDSESEFGFVIYFEKIKDNDIYSYIIGSHKKIYRLLEKYSGSQPFKELRNDLNLKQEERICFDVNILFEFNNQILSEIAINPQKISYTYDNNLNLYNCIDLFSSEEILEGDNKWYCNKCKQFREVVKKMEIYKSPYYLIVQIKRFNGLKKMAYDSNKNNTFIDFPVTDLDLSKYIIDDKYNKKYNLIGVINHYGGNSFGHYTSYCLNNGKWYEFNDKSVNLIENEKNIISMNAYILFYKRKE